MDSYEVKASPAARKLGRELGIDLSGLVPEGSSKIIQISDVLNAQNAQNAKKQEKPAPRSQPTQRGYGKDGSYFRPRPRDEEASHVLNSKIQEPAATQNPQKPIASFRFNEPKPTVAEEPEEAAPDNLFDYNYVKDKPSFENMLDAVEKHSRASAQGEGLNDFFRFKDMTIEPEIGEAEKQTFADKLTQQFKGKIDSMLDDDTLTSIGQDEIFESDVEVVEIIEKEPEPEPEIEPEPEAKIEEADEPPEEIPDLILAEEDSFLREAVIEPEASPPEAIAAVYEEPVMPMAESDPGIIEFSYAQPEYQPPPAPFVDSAFNRKIEEEEMQERLPAAFEQQMARPAYSFDRSIIYEPEERQYIAPMNEAIASQISSKITVMDGAIMKLLSKLKIGYRLGIVKVIIKACSHTLEKLNFQLCDRIAVVNTESDFDSYSVNNVVSTPIQSLAFNEVLDMSAMSGILLTVWDLSSLGLDSYTATNLEGINIFVHHNDEALKIEMETSDKVMDCYKAIQFMGILKECLEKPSRFL